MEKWLEKYKMLLSTLKFMISFLPGKCNSKNKICVMRLKLTPKTPERSQLRYYRVFTVKFVHSAFN